MRLTGVALAGTLFCTASALSADIDAQWKAYDAAMPCESATSPADALMNCTSLIMFIGYDLAAKNGAEAMPPLVARALYFRGMANIALKQWDKALYDFNEAIGKRADYPEAYAARGNVYEQLGRVPDAIADWKQAWQLGDRSDALAGKLRSHGAM